MTIVPDRFAKLIDSHPLPGWLHDAQTLRFLHVNDAMIAAAGYSRRRLLAIKVTDIGVSGAGTASGRRGKRETGDAGSPPAVLWRLRSKHGKTIDIRAASRRVPIRGRRAVLVLAHRTARGGPREPDLMASLPIGIYRSGLDGPIIDANPMFVRMLGYPNRKTLLARRAADLYVDPGVRDQWLAKLTHNGVVTNFESQLRRYDGSAIWVRASARVVRSPAGRNVYLEGAVVDITETKLAAAKQAQRTAELETFHDLSRRLRTTLTTDEMYPLIVERTRSLLDAYHGCLALLNPEGLVFTRVYTVGIVGEKIGSTFPSRGTRSGRVVNGGTPLVSGDFSRERVPEWMASSPYRALGPLMIVPVRSEEGIIGTLTMARVRGSDRGPFGDGEVHLLEGIAEITGIAIQRAQLNERLQEANVQMVVALAHVMESRDAYTARHSQRLVALGVRVARALGCSDEEVQDIRWAARLHDIGKVAMPDALLRKPEALTEQEWTVMRQHPLLGEEILSSVWRLRGASKLVRHHQETWDGTGYPDGLKGEAIPLGARILAVVDAFGAITETRPYRAAQTRAQAIAEIKRCAGTQFDPRVVAAFCAVVEQRNHDARRDG